MNQLRKYINLVEATETPNYDKQNVVDYSATSSKLDENVKIILDKLQKECSEIYAIYKRINKFLYRGVKTHKSVFYQEIRKDRKPVILPVVAHAAFNQVLVNNGFEATRGNSIFTTPNIEVAADWGTRVFVVFPKDGFKYTWFTAIRDRDSNYIWNDINTIYKTSQNLPDYDLHDEISKLADELKPMKTNIEQAILAGEEVLITGQGYYGIQYNQFERYFLPHF